MRIPLIACLLLSVALAGCTTEDTGTASIYVKDAPVDEFDEIHLLFTKVEIHRSGGNETGGWITLYDNATGQDIDLLDLSGARAAFLGEAELEAGQYQQIRVHAIEAYGVQNDTRVEFLTSPTPFKIRGQFEIAGGEETRITLDIDLNKSVKELGNGSYRMTPQIGETFAETVQDDESGAEVHAEGEATELEELE